jgi:hypothetical protein
VAISLRITQKGSKELGHFLNVLAKNLPKQARRIEQSAPEIGQAIGNLILSHIESDHPIGDFMAPRTDIQQDSVEGGVNIAIGGLSEAYVEDPEHVPQQETDASLWAAHEFGFETGDVEDTYMEMKSEGYPEYIVYDQNGDPLKTRERQSYYVDKYRGEIRSILDQLAPQIQQLLGGLTAVQADAAISKAIEVASKGKIRVSAGAAGILSRAGLTTSDLQRAGVTGAFVNPVTGGLTVRGPSGRFVATPKPARGIRFS